MSLIRYQNPQTAAWPSLDRWANLREELNSLFDLPLHGNSAHQAQLFGGWTPPLDLHQDADNVVATVELPGMRKEDIEISLQDGTLSISGERKATSEIAERSERFSGKFRRSISVPSRIDANKVSASYKDGILTITLPKSEEAKPKKIEVSVD